MAFTRHGQLLQLGTRNLLSNTSCYEIALRMKKCARAHPKTQKCMYLLAQISFWREQLAQHLKPCGAHPAQPIHGFRTGIYVYFYAFGSTMFNAMRLVCINIVLEKIHVVHILIMITTKISTPPTAPPLILTGNGS